MMQRTLGYGLALALAAAACTNSYGGNAADPPPGPTRTTPRAADAGAEAGRGETDAAAKEDPTDAPSDPTTPRVLEVTAYYAGYTAQTLPVSQLDRSHLDEVSHFAVIPRPDGSLDDATNVISAASSTTLVGAAKRANVRTTLCVGGAGAGAAFAAAARDHRADLVNAIAASVADRGYDGVDVDWEPIAPADQASFVALVADLRAKLGANKKLTAAVPVDAGALVAPAAAHLDRIHLMTYDLAGPWPGWVTWHNAALHHGDATFPSTGAKLPSVEDAVSEYLAAGVPAEKLMLGISHIGYAWRGGSAAGGAALVAPRMTWSTAPSFQPLTIREISDLETAERAKWDDVSKTPFLSIDEPGTANDEFITYENEESQRAKVSFARDRGLAGVFVWDIAAGYRPAQATPLALMKSLQEDAKGSN